MYLLAMTKTTMLTALYLIFAAMCIGRALASTGDRTQFFKNCRENCERNNCTADGIGILEHAAKYYRQTMLDWTWSCADECQYGCMWSTVAAFQDRDWQVPQFYGKWPFVRFMGLQEPAAVLFSVLNLVAHLRMIRKFRQQVPKQSPCFTLWHLFAIVCCNGWIWSIVFHARDLAITEFLDYVFAYSIILMMLYCMIMRMLVNWPVLVRMLISLGFLAFYLNYFAYTGTGRISYSWNMWLNITTGVLSALGWLIWCYFVRQRRPYHKAIIRFYILFGLAMSLEILDFPPILWTFDAHALWHLATTPLVGILYDFAILDCKALYKEKMLDKHKFDKVI